MLVGLSRPYPGGYSGVLLTSGTPIGDMTSNGGLAAAFDGSGNQGGAASARKVTTTTAYIGLSYGSAKRIYKARYVGANDTGVVQPGTTPNVTITLYGKTGSAPSSGTDGTNLGSLTFADSDNESETIISRIREITVANPFLSWDHNWFYVTQDGVANHMYCAECRLYEAL